MYISNTGTMSHYKLVSQLPPDQLQDDVQPSASSFSDKTSTQLQQPMSLHHWRSVNVPKGLPYVSAETLHYNATV